MERLKTEHTSTQTDDSIATLNRLFDIVSEYGIPEDFTLDPYVVSKGNLFDFTILTVIIGLGGLLLAVLKYIYPRGRDRLD